MVSYYATLLAAASLLAVPSRQEQHPQSCPPAGGGGDENGGKCQASRAPPGGTAEEDGDGECASVVVAGDADDDDRRPRPPPEDGPRFPGDFVHPCQDDEPLCPIWASEGECRFNSLYMLRECARSCGTCQSPTTGEGEGEGGEGAAATAAACVDVQERCGEWADGGECWINPDCEFRGANPPRIDFALSPPPRRRRPTLTEFSLQTCSPSADTPAGSASMQGWIESWEWTRPSC